MSEVRWASPQLLLAGFLFLVSLGYAVTGGALRPVPAAQPLAVDVGPPDLRAVEVRYVVVDVHGLERPGYADIGLPQRLTEDPSARLGASLAALRADLAEIGVWPVAVGAPVGFFIELDRRRIAVVDVAAVPAGSAIDAAIEWAAVRSLVATARLAVAADEVRITVGGEERPSLWGRVALGAD